MILDFHTHAFPDHLAGRAVPQLAQQAGIPYYRGGDEASLRNSMARAGINYGVLLNIATVPKHTDNVNAFGIEVMRRNPSPPAPQIITFASVHPFDPAFRERLRAVKAQGYQGVKLHPNYQRFYVDDPALEPFYQETADLDLILMFHAGYDDGLPAPIYATPLRFDRIMHLLERGRTILAHMGSESMYQGVLGLICGKNVYFDTSYALERMDFDVAKEIFRKHGPERFLFGSDSPWGDQKASVECFRDRFARGFLSDRDINAVLWDNGARLLGLKKGQAIRELISEQQTATQVPSTGAAW